MDSSIREEVRKDFEESLSDIDFSSYNPSSKEFMTSVLLGAMMMALDCMDESSVSVQTASVAVENSSDEISDEIHGSKKYLQRYLDTKDETFRKMSQDELNHASYLIRKAYNKPIGSEEKSKLKSYEYEIEQMNKRIKES